MPQRRLSESKPIFLPRSRRCELGRASHARSSPRCPTTSRVRSHGAKLGPPFLRQLPQVAHLLAHVAGVDEIQPPAERALPPAAAHKLPVEEGPRRIQDLVEPASAPGRIFVFQVVLR